MKKISVVVFINSNIKSLYKCVNSIINQNYSNLEILIFNNQTEQITGLNDERIKIIEVNNELSIHDIRVLSLDYCSGDYISFINSSDYISCDYYSMLLNNILENKSDIAVSSYIDVKDNCVYNFISGSEVYECDDILDTFFKTEGKNNRWYLTCLKLIEKRLFNDIFKDYKKISTNGCVEDDILISMLLFLKSKKVSFCDLAEYFLSLDDNYGCNFSKNIFNNKICSKYKEYIKNWSIESSDSCYYLSKSDYNDGLEKIKKKILDNDVKVVSFDMFDTLVVRPFYKPLDMFYLMDKDFIKILKCNPVVKFSKIRVEAEEELRKQFVEVTLEQIYDYISDFYGIDKKKILELKRKEESLEIEFCVKRNTGYQLYSLAKSLNKKVIVTSDIYLSREVIEKILNNNNYDFDYIYLSSELMKTKSNGDLFEYVIANEKTNAIVHIGDNKYSDIEVAERYNLKVGYLPRTIDTMMNETNINVNGCGYLYQDFDMFNINSDCYLKNYGVRCSIAVVANKYFDNPFKSFMNDTKFNSDPRFIGYFALGMHLLSLSNWILNDTKTKGIDSISFMARDGFLSSKSTSILNSNTKLNDNLIINYIYVSRKALMPLVLSNKVSINAIDTYIDYKLFSPKSLLEQFMFIIDESKIEIYKNVLLDKGYNYDTLFENRESFYKCLVIIYDNIFDSDKYSRYLEMVKKYFSKYLVGNASVFDIGYSGKPESIISDLIGKPIHTYFFHSTSSDAYNNSYISDCKLNTFYDFMPTLTGTIRELFYSDSNPSCIGYKDCCEDVEPIFAEDEKYFFFNRQMLELVQKNALLFVDDFSKIFSKYISAIDLNRFYLSMPFEYFCNYASLNDRLLFNDLIFESNVNDSNYLNYYIDIILDNYKYYNKKRFNDCLNNELNKIIPDIENDMKNNLIREGYGKLPKSKFNRMIYYLLFDREKIGLKWKELKNRKNNSDLLPNNKYKRILYYVVFDRERLLSKLKRK